MPAARYWRIVGISTYGGGDLELGEIALYDGETRVDGSATLTSAFAPIAGSLANLQDDDTGTAARFAAADVRSPSFAFEWDFGESETADLTKILFGTGATRDLSIYACDLQYASTPGVWTTWWALRKIEWPGATSYVDVRRGYAAPGGAAAYYGFDEAPGATSFTDRGPTGLVTHGAPVTMSVSHAQSRFGAGSLVPTGGNGVGYVDFSLNGFTVAEQETFTVEFWASGFSTSTSFRPRLVEIGKSSGVVFFWETAGWTTDSIPHPSTDASTTVTGLTQLPTGDSTFVHISIVCGQGFFRVYANGVLRINSTGRALRPGGGLWVRLGKTWNYFTSLRNFFDGFTFYPGVEFRTANFTPPTFEPEFTLGQEGPMVRAPALATPGRVSEYPVPDWKLTTVENTVIDETHGGVGTITGTVTRFDDPNFVPVSRRVRLYDERGRMLARETWSDPVTGTFTFLGLRTDIAWTAMAYDHTGHYRALIIDRLEAV
jgi:hypothetical protein